MEEQEEQQQAEAIPEPVVTEEVVQEEIVPEQIVLGEEAVAPTEMSDLDLRAVVEAVVYITEEPLSIEQIAIALQQDKTRIQTVIAALLEDCSRPERGVIIKEVAGGFKMGTKPEHHDVIRQFVKNLKQPLKLSLAALETLAVIAYKQPITAPEIMEIRGVQGAGVLKTLLERKLIMTSGRKNVVGKPILYKTTREFLVQFGLSGINELPTLKEFEELRRLAIDEEIVEATYTEVVEIKTEAEASSESDQPAVETVEELAPEAAEELAKAAVEGNQQ